MRPEAHQSSDNPPKGRHPFIESISLFKLGRNFNVFWFGQTLSGLGDAFALLAVPLLVLQATGSVAQMGLVTGTFGLFQLLAGSFSGILVDRLNRRRLMIACDLGRFVVYSLIPTWWLLAGPQIWLIYVTAALGSLLGNIFSVGAITAVANLVDKDQITDANSRMQISGGLTFMVGPMLAGVISGLFSPAAAIGVDAVSFLVSALSLMFIRLRTIAVAMPPSGDAKSYGLDDLLAGLRYLFRQPLLRTVTVVLGVTGTVQVGGMDLFVYRLKHDLHQSADTVGIVFGLAGLGAIAAGMLTPSIRRRVGFGATWIGGLLGQGVALIAFALTGSIPLLVLLADAFAFASMINGVTNMSLRQEITPDHLLGRVTAAFWTLAGVAAPVGAAVSTALAAKFGAPAILAAMGVITAIMAVISIGTPVNHRHPELLYAPDRAETHAASVAT
jgi:MFS family permease